MKASMITWVEKPEGWHGSCPALGTTYTITRSSDGVRRWRLYVSRDGRVAYFGAYKFASRAKHRATRHAVLG